ncbi:hypothetical protein A2954_00710 [Candidatus Roizmanbacteria bacterium RIFCSPLOWO2_01_FULL_37_12]|uniref:Peptidase S9 prolyl oligopeptidase catalytic domain-containing protein n=1 Tax=Candidatus Roizmanbacteria bacterium RIFCSPLOWO2_01_FULL_37_12 TaxID=1802056 RepID=A0A1F7IDT1_9BACT|nr:MAG: hypothetical protein A2954_00710 [Candidatus Roizmanbacteria bacterium RIFCSPLOWO2_01_FULL_37_12]
MESAILFNDSNGDKLSGIINNPSGDKNKLIVILVHGFHSSKNTKSFGLLRELLEKKNISTFRIDIWGHGESEGLFENITISEAVDDILQAIKFLKEQGYKKIGLLGSSFGGNASIMAASKTNDLVFLTLKSPVSDYGGYYEKEFTPDQIKDWKVKGYTYRADGEDNLKLNYSFYDDIKNNLGYDVASQIKIPTLIVHGDADPVVPVEQSVKTSKLIPNCKLVLIKGADHTYTNPDHFKVMSNTFAEFISSYI